MLEINNFFSLENLFFQLIISALIGAFVGIRRETELQKNHQKGFRGLRTTTLVTVFGTLSTFFNKFDFLPLIFFLVLSVFIFIVYKNGVENKRIGITSELSILLMFWVGVLIGYQMFWVGILLALFIAISDAYREQMHHFAKGFNLKEWSGTLQMLLITLFILPFLPNEKLGVLLEKQKQIEDIDNTKIIIEKSIQNSDENVNFNNKKINITKNKIERLEEKNNESDCIVCNFWKEINLYKIWLLVVLISGIRFIGYFFHKYLKSSKIKGVYVTSFVGSIVSSTAVTVELAQEVKNMKIIPKYILPALLLAISVMEFRDFVIIIVGSGGIIWQFLLTTIIMSVSSLILAYYFWKQDRKNDEKVELNIENSSPFEIIPALKFALLFILVLFLVYFLKYYFSDSAIYVSAAVVGLVDTESFILSVLENYNNQVVDFNTVKNSIAIVLIVNTIIKLLYIQIFAGWKVVKKVIGVVLLVSALGLIQIFI